jgi:hypothetical protein
MFKKIKKEVIIFFIIIKTIWVVENEKRKVSNY